MVTTAAQHPDAPAECSHTWRLVRIALVLDEGAPSDYECTQCGAALHRAAGEPLPTRPVWD